MPIGLRGRIIVMVAELSFLIFADAIYRVERVRCDVPV